jgi:hypothetical protein
MLDDDDDPTTVPAGNEPASEKTQTPSEPPEGEEPEGEEVAAEASDDEEVDAVDDDEPDEDDGEEGETKRSRWHRHQEKLRALRAENEALRTRSSDGGNIPSDPSRLQYAIEQRVRQEIGDPPDPNDPRYRDDYVSLSMDRQAYATDYRLARRQVVKELAQSIQSEQVRVGNRVAEHKERVEKFAKKVPDYKQVMNQATMPVAPHIERLLLESKKSEHLAYVLAKDQSKLARLNNMDPENAAREIGRLEGRLSLPQKAKQQTQARAPIKPLKGSGASPPSQTAAMNTYLKKIYGDRL